MYILKDGACEAAWPRFRVVWKIQDSGICRRVRIALEPGYGGDSGFAGEQNLQRDGLLGVWDGKGMPERIHRSKEGI
ncbi:MAG: hypothetical protein K2P48_03460 [Lachnospiraceae bacterium]|nr:hypothetical protein [Lachnospiraceae bacterium]